MVWPMRQGDSNMYKVYDPQNGFRLISRAPTIKEALRIAQAWANATKREQWVDNPHGTLQAVAMPA